MADYVPLTNLRGPAARITSATAATVPAGDPAEVVMTGPDQNRGFAFAIPTGPQGIPGVNGVENDAAVAAYVAAPTTDTFAALVEMVKATSGRIPASAFGVQADTGTDQSFALHTAFAAAEAAGGGRVIQLPGGVVTISGGFALSGYSSGLIGGASSAKPALVTSGTILRAISQTGPVLDFTGYLYPRGQQGRVVFSDFAVEGDGTVGPDKKGVYLSCGGSSSSIDLERITISKTGGVGLHVRDHYLSDFHAVTVCTPVDAAAQDTPYVLLEGANGNRYYGLGIRSLDFSDAADMGASGAVRLTEGITFQHHQSLFVGMWFENMHTPTNGALVVTRTNSVTFTDTQYFDCYKATGATNTAHFRIEVPTTQSYGGNEIRGRIPGKGNGTTQLDAGVVVRQDGNKIEGVKGPGGANVILDPGVQYTHAHMTGAVLAGNSPAFTDNSGNSTNTLIDGPQGVWILGERAGLGSLRIGGLFQTDKVDARGTIVANWTPNVSTGGNIFTLTLGANVAMTGVTGGQVGRRMTLMITQDGTGGRTMSWPSIIRFSNGSAPTLSTGAGRTDIFEFIYNGAVWIEVNRSLNATSS